jgi:hypothetical protein
MILTLGLGIALWVAYGFAQRDVVIILANGISLLLLLGIIYFKWRPQAGGTQTIKNDIVPTFFTLAARSLRHRRNKALLEDVWDSGSNDR